MFKHHNQHPDKKIVRDCVKRAISLALQEEYKTTQINLNRIKREISGRGFNDPKVYEEYLFRAGGELISFPAVKGQSRMDGFQFSDEYPEGRYILRMAGHLSVCIDGIIFDTFDCRRKCIYKAWKITTTTEED